MPKSVRWILGGVIAVIILVAIAWQWDWYARTVVIREHPECLTTSQHPEDSAYIPPCAYALVPQTLWQQLFGFIAARAPAPYDAAEAAILACYPEDPSGVADTPIPNNSVQQVVDTTRMFINMPKDLYPKDISRSWTTVSGNATGGWVSNGGLPGEAEGALPGCWSTYVELDGNGEVDLRVKSVATGTPDYFVRFIISSNPPPSSSATTDQAIVKDANPPTPAPAGYQAFTDAHSDVTFDAPVDWKPQYVPEGDGTLSMVSPDFSGAQGSMKGAYIHYSLLVPSGAFGNNPDGLMASLKQGEGITWSDTTLDGHPAYITRNESGYAMIASKFSDSLIVTISLVDPGKKYGAAFDEFIESFKML